MSNQQRISELLRDAMPQIIGATAVIPEPPLAHSNLRDQFIALEKALDPHFIERSDTIRALILALLTGHPIALIGVPGTSKTKLIDWLCRAVNARKFKATLSPTSVPDELLGGVIFSRLEEGIHERNVEGYLPSAEIAFVDEPFKCNSATLNNLLDILVDKKFKNGTKVLDVPLRLFAGASNEIPDDIERPELGALWDRFVLRVMVDRVKPDNRLRLLKVMAGGDRYPDDMPQLSIAEVDAARREVSEVDVDGALPYVAELWNEFEAREGLLRDRKMGQFLRVLQAQAWLSGRSRVIARDCKTLKFIGWNTMEEHAKVQALVDSLVTDRFAAEVDQLLEQATAMLNTARNDRSRLASSAVAIKQVILRLEQLRVRAEQEGEDLENLEAAFRKVDGIYRTTIELVKAATKA